MEVKDRNILVDHVDRNPLNNLRENLRLANKSSNGMNREKPSNNTSGYKGVGFDKSRSLWTAQIQCNNKMIHIGRYDTSKEAAMAYDSVARDVFGEFAVLNFPKVFMKITGIKRVSKKSTTKYGGVSFIKATGKYCARSKIKGYEKFIGNFDNPEEAAKAYDEYVCSIGKPSFANGKRMIGG